MAKPTIMKTPTKKPMTPDTMKMGVSIPTGYVDPGQIDSPAPGVPDTMITPGAAPKLSGPTTQRKIGAQLGMGPETTKGAIIPANDAKMQDMMGGVGTAPTQQTSATGGKTPENAARENKKYQSLLKQFGLS